MSRDGSGAYSLPEAPFVYGTVIDEGAVNSNFSDIASALTGSIASDGQTTPTANLPMGSFRHTGVGNASARNQYAATGQVQDGAFLWCGTAGGTADALTLSPTPSITAYAAGQVFRFKAGASANTAATTVAVSGLAAKDIQFNGAALAGAEIQAGKWYEVLYDGTQFQIRPIAGAEPALFLPERAAAPSTAAGILALYAKTVGSAPKLFTRLESDGSEIMLEPNIVTATYATQESTTSGTFVNTNIALNITPRYSGKIVVFAYTATRVEKNDTTVSASFQLYNATTSTEIATVPVILRVGTAGVSTTVHQIPVMILGQQTGLTAGTAYGIRIRMVSASGETTYTSYGGQTSLIVAMEVPA